MVSDPSEAADSPKLGMTLVLLPVVGTLACLLIAQHYQTRFAGQIQHYVLYPTPVTAANTGKSGSPAMWTRNMFRILSEDCPYLIALLLLGQGENREAQAPNHSCPAIKLKPTWNEEALPLLFWLSADDL